MENMQTLQQKLCLFALAAVMSINFIPVKPMTDDSDSDESSEGLLSPREKDVSSDGDQEWAPTEKKAAQHRKDASNKKARKLLGVDTEHEQPTTPEKKVHKNFSTTHKNLGHKDDGKIADPAAQREDLEKEANANIAWLDDAKEIEDALREASMAQQALLNGELAHSGTNHELKVEILKSQITKMNDYIKRLEQQKKDKLAEKLKNRSEIESVLKNNIKLQFKILSNKKAELDKEQKALKSMKKKPMPKKHIA